MLNNANATVDATPEDEDVDVEAEVEELVVPNREWRWGDPRNSTDRVVCASNIPEPGITPVACTHHDRGRNFILRWKRNVLMPGTRRGG